MNVIDAVTKCVGCGACVDVCHVDALCLKHNLDGFYEASLTDKSCVGCGKCTQACPAINPRAGKNFPEFYYGWHIDDTVRRRSSSGGAFSALAEKIVREGGVVFGARYSDDHKSVQMTSSEECDWTLFCGSKYCQSAGNGLYRKIADCLHKGRRVMLVGTPCQVAAARRNFGSCDNLILVDFLCGGVAPDTIFAEYTAWLEEKYHAKIKNINMRTKRWGWSKQGMHVEFENGKVYSKRYQFDPYYHYYNNGPTIKNAPCLTCAYTEHLDADITVADFWGYRGAGVAKDEKGISLVCAYTEKGKAMVDDIQESFIFHPLREEHVAYAYKEKHHSGAALQRRAGFLEVVRQGSFMRAVKQDHFKYGEIGVLMRVLIRKVVRK